MKILFWFYGSGGSRRNRKVVDFPNITNSTLSLCKDEIYEALDEWKDSLRSNSGYQRWGWDEKFDETTLEPLSKI